MGITHVKGGFFDKEHTAAHESFGFHKQAKHASTKPSGVSGVEGAGSPGYKAPMTEQVKGNNHFAKGGQPHSDAAQDRVLIKKMMAQHDKAEGEKPVGLARGGRAILPRGMKPPAMQAHSPINTPPRKPQVTRTPTNAMPGGQMPYGVQPSSEPGYGSAAAADPSAPPAGLKRGGRVRRADGGAMGGDDSGSGPMGNLGISQPQGLKKGGRVC